MFIPMLSAFPGSRKPLNLKVTFGNANSFSGNARKNRNNNCAGVDAPASLSGRNTLEAMAPSFVLKSGEVFASNRNTGEAIRNAFALTLSALTGAQLLVRGREVSN